MVPPIPMEDTIGSPASANIPISSTISGDIMDIEAPVSITILLINFDLSLK